MGKQNNRICCICGKTYTFCPVCNSGDTNKPTWYFTFCGENCKDIYNVCTQYRDKELSPAEAQAKIMKLDITNIDNFAEATQAQIHEILDYKSFKPMETKVEPAKEVEMPKYEKRKK